MSWSPSVPYVVGQWVRGPTFYGRRKLCERLLGGARRRIWVVGRRRSGKTSLLRHVELQAGADRSQPLVGVYWDVEGSDTWRDLGLTLEDALLDSGQRLEGLGVHPDTMTGLSPAEMVAELARRLAELERELLLLVDEAEELARIGRNHPRELAHLLDPTGPTRNVRWVIASSPQLEHQHEGRSSHLASLDPFTPPIRLGPLTDAEADQLLVQAHLPEEARPRLSEEELERLRSACGNSPFLLQLAGRRLLDSGDLEQVVDQLGRDRMVTSLVAVDLELLRPGDRRLLAEVATAQPAVPLTDQADQAGVERLMELGFLRLSPDGRLLVAGLLLERCLRDLGNRLRS